MCDMPDEPSEQDIERQKKLEADSLENGVSRLIQRREHLPATDSKDVQDLMSDIWPLVVEVIRREQLAIKSPECVKLPKFGAALLSLKAEKLALIVLGILLNIISRSEAEDDVPPTVTSVSEPIAQRCWLERMYDLDRKRAVDLARELLSRNRNRNAKRRSDDYAQKFDKARDSQDDCWLHLAEKANEKGQRELSQDRSAA